MSLRKFVFFAVAAISTFLAVTYLLIASGIYAITLFAPLPLFAGGTGVLLIGAPSRGQAAWIGALSAAFGCLFWLVIGLEGFLYVAMAVPFAAPLGALGGLIVHANLYH